MRILLVEDTIPLRRSLQTRLAQVGHAVDAAADGETGWALMANHGYDLVILDVTLPGIDGWTLLRRLRTRSATTGALVLSAESRLAERVQALELGADDFLLKPFAMAEFLARVRALLRRVYHAPDPLIRIDDLEIDLTKRSARRAGLELRLTRREFALLEYLALRQGQIVTRPEIIAHLFQAAGRKDGNIVNVYVGYLRRKLDRQGMRPLLRTRHGVGYGLQAGV